MCMVCGAKEGEVHFGGISCRACAAFFRRYFHSKKIAKICTCKERKEKSHPCRKCRVEKCLKIGMTPEKVQGSRDRNADELAIQTIPSSSKQSLLTARIYSKEVTKLTFAIPTWHDFLIKRLEGKDDRMWQMNVYEVTAMTKMDIQLTWNMAECLFPFVRELGEKDKTALLRNFHLKFWIIYPLLDVIKNPKLYENMNKAEYEKMIVSFYDGAFVEGKEMSNEEIVRVFEPFWWSFYSRTAPPIAELRLEKMEVMGLVWLTFFDHGYTNISVECQEMCRTMRKMIYLELKNYQKSREFDEMRFIETVETLEIIERGEKKFMEEMMICEMSNIKIHDDFREILRENKY
ncbi:unnamed protein product [Caenorhabditis brenneri]